MLGTLREDPTALRDRRNAVTCLACGVFLAPLLFVCFGFCCSVERAAWTKPSLSPLACFGFFPFLTDVRSFASDFACETAHSHLVKKSDYSILVQLG